MGILISVFKNYLKYGFDINTPSRTRTTPQQISQPNPLKIEHSRNKSKLKQKTLATQNFFGLNFTSHYILELKCFSRRAECVLFSHVRISHGISEALWYLSRFTADPPAWPEQTSLPEVGFPPCLAAAQSPQEPLFQ